MKQAMLKRQCARTDRRAMCELDAAERLFDELRQTNFSDASAFYRLFGIVCLSFSSGPGKVGGKK